MKFSVLTSETWYWMHGTKKEKMEEWIMNWCSVEQKWESEKDDWLVLLFCASHVSDDGNLETFHAVTLPSVDPGYPRVAPILFLTIFSFCWSSFKEKGCLPTILAFFVITF